MGKMMTDYRSWDTEFRGASLSDKNRYSTWLSVGVCLDLLRLAVPPARLAVWTMARRVLSIVMVAAAIATLLSQSLSFLAAPNRVPRSVVVPAAAIAPMLWESQCAERGTHMFRIEASDLCNRSMGVTALRTILSHHEASWHHEWKHHEPSLTAKDLRCC